MPRDTQPDLIKRLESGYALPVLSAVAVKLVELASDDTSSAQDLAQQIEKDSSLTVRLLRIANSAFYNTGEPVKTIKQAVVRVGFHRLRIMALSLSIRDTFPMKKIGPMDYEKFWRTSLYRSLLAKSFAGQLKTCNPEEAFVAGLILEIGLLIFFDLFMKGKGKQPLINIDLDQLETLLLNQKEQYGLNHREVGAAALRHWKFPESIIQSQSLWGAAAQADEAPILTRMCELARNFSQALFQQSLWSNALVFETGRRFGLDHEVISSILIQIFQQVEEIAASLKVELNKKRDLIEIMEKANKALSRILEKISTVKQLTIPESFPSLGELDRASGSKKQSQGDKEAIVTRTLQAVAHEIRNPILAVGGFAKKLSESLDPMSAECRLAKVILDEAQRLEKVFFEITRDFV